MATIPSTRKTFTLVETLIAMGVFTLFFGGLFAFYRMGSSMYSSGTWRFTQQKAAQHFLLQFKERLEQTANLTAVNPGLATQVSIVPTPLYTVPVGTVVDFSTLTNPKNLLFFTVTKPALADSGRKGLNMPHALIAIPGPPATAGRRRTGELRLFGTNDINSTVFTSTIAGFPANNTVGDWSGTPQQFGLGNPTFDISLTGIGRIEIDFGNASTTTGPDVAKVYSLNLVFPHPESRYANASFTQTVQAKIPFGVDIQGGL
ncbi:MAG: hypothetical protein GX442_22895 [Candidatus Riflebacteria bacterium]|nr:hypothetical protein [Candidatus Riflebacteria bacterium]